MSIYFDIEESESPLVQYWTWKHPTRDWDTVALEYSSLWSDLEYNASQGCKFWFFDESAQGIMLYNEISIETSMSISGPDLDCSKPVSYSLLNFPDTLASASWVIKQGAITRASGTGTTASTSNIQDGEARVTFTVDFTCGLDDLVMHKDFYYGVPDPTIDGPTYLECEEMQWYFLNPEDRWGGTYSWSTSYHFSIKGGSNWTKVLVSADEDGTGTIYCDVSNTCGTGYGSLPVWIDECFGFRMSPNPADDIVEISLDENYVDLNNILEYEIKIFNSQQFLLTNSKTKDSSIQFDTSHFNDGIYYVHVIYDGNTCVQQLVISH